MGLDMTLYKVAPPTFTEDTRYFVAEKGELDPVIFYPTIMSKAQFTKKVNKYWDIDKINKEFSVVVDYISMMCYDKIRLQCKDHEPVEIPRERFDEFTKEVEDDVYAVDLTEIDYQRKGLDDDGWALLPENCSFCDDKDLITEMTKYGLSKTFISNWVDGETVFHPWW